MILEAQATIVILSLMSSLHFSLLIIFLVLPEADSIRWIKSAYYDSVANLPASGVNSALFTHLYYAFAAINSSSHQLTFSDESAASAFTASVTANNPSLVTLLSIGLAYSGNYSTFSSMVTQSSSRHSFIMSSIQKARLYGFGGLDLCWVWPNSTSDITNIGILLDEWRSAINSEAANSAHLPPLLLTMAVHVVNTNFFPVDSMKRNLDWANLVAFDFHLPLRDHVTGYHAALYDPQGHVDIDSGLREWTGKGFPANKIVLGLPYHGYAWKLVNPNNDSVGSAASGPDITIDGSVGYKTIKSFISDYGYGASSYYNSTCCVSYLVIKSTWVNFDDVEAIRCKVSYAKVRELLGYFAFQLANDNNWKLSRTAYQVGEHHENKKQFWVKFLVPMAALVFSVAIVGFYVRCKTIRSEGLEIRAKREVNEHDKEENAPNLRVFTLSEIKAATSDFSIENKLGEGGYGPVYKGKLASGAEVAVKRLSTASNQGLKEFENEIKLTAKLQHVNLVRLLGYCTEAAEKVLIYDYMPNKSLDFYLFDCQRRLKLNWEKRVDIIEGIAQGLAYLQEYSNFTIIHRDIKASNILLDDQMKPKISDFGIARVFRKEDGEAKTAQIVGTYGYVPPEYAKKGVYSIKYDVYSFGVLLLQIISGKKHSLCYGSSEDLNLLEHAYELWRSDNGSEFIDSTLDDSFSAYKILNCLKVALLCVQESAMDRPTMLEVCSMLKIHNIYSIPSPKRPAFSISVPKHEQNVSTSTQQFCSVNTITVSHMFPR